LTVWHSVLDELTGRMDPLWEAEFLELEYEFWASISQAVKAELERRRAAEQNTGRRRAA
jgi:hypothetical protein